MGYCVIKIGGRVVSEDLDSVASDIQQLVGNGWKPIIVHGGGRIVDTIMGRLGIKPRYLRHPSGFRSRYTGREELEVYVMVMSGLIAKKIQISLAEKGVASLSLTGLDSGIIKARRKDRVVIINEKGRMQVVDGGYTGRITNVDSDMIMRILSSVDALILSPIAFSPTGEEGSPTPLNVDADQMAYKIAAAIKAPLVMVTDVPGVIVDGEVLKRVRVEDAPKVLESVGEGMNRKLEMARRAVSEGAPIAVIGSKPIPELLRGGRGTVVTQ